MAAAAERQKHAVWVGVRFLKEFFQNLATAPAEVAGYYAVDCVLMDLEEGAVVNGLPAVSKYYADKAAGKKYTFSKVVAHMSGVGVMVIAWGTELQADRTRDFTRTFVLQPTREAAKGEEAPTGYRAGKALFSVQNDVVEWRGPYVADPPTNDGATQKAAAASPVPAAKAPAPAAAAPKAAEPSGSKAPRPLTWAEKASASLGATLYSTAATVCQRVVGGGEKEEQQAGVKPPVAVAAEPVRGRPAGPASSPSLHTPHRRDMSPSEKYQYAALYISGLPPDMTEADVDRLFKPFGTIKGKTFRQGAFCFIDYEDKASVRAACAKGPIKFKNVTLTVQERKSPEQRAAEKDRNKAMLMKRK
eukprot:TRINITY_DN22473_c0_g1_i1.p1 TRINITY_DN22473_c0_g1~~TRINITY_DN22473_c0_g1_i1.p1  ORF type:complete len:386 (+),score=145.35 TRINITY_DN22473_c0_g1_i1:79-1158(+)